MFLLKGFASTPTVDAEHCSFALKSISWDALPPLKLEHRKRSNVGQVIKLEWQLRGLWAEVAVDDEHREIKGFSVSAFLEAYEIKGQGASAYGIVTKARFDELSVTNSPVNADCVIVTREQYTPRRESNPITKRAADTDIASYLERKQARDAQMAFWLAEMRAGL